MRSAASSITLLAIALTLVTALVGVLSSFRTVRAEAFEEADPVLQQASLLNKNIAALTDSVKQLPARTATTNTPEVQAGMWDRYSELQGRMNRLEASKEDSLRDLYGNQMMTDMKVESLIQDVRARGNVEMVAAQVPADVDRLRQTVMDISNNMEGIQKWREVMDLANEYNTSMRESIMMDTKSNIIVMYPGSTNGFTPKDASDLPPFVGFSTKEVNRTHILRSQDHHEMVFAQAYGADGFDDLGVDAVIDGRPGQYHSMALGPLEGRAPSAVIGTQISSRTGDGEELVIAKAGPGGRIRQHADSHVFDVATAPNPVQVGEGYYAGAVMRASESDARKKTMLRVDKDGVHMDRHMLRSTDQGDLLVCERAAPDRCTTLHKGDR